MRVSRFDGQERFDAAVEQRRIDGFFELVEHAVDEADERVRRGDGAVGLGGGDAVEQGEMVVDRPGEVVGRGDMGVVDVPDAPEDRVQRPQRMLQEGLARGREDHLVDAPVERVEGRQRHLLALVAQQPRHVQHLVAVHRAGPVRREAGDEALEVAAQLQQQALAGEVDRRDLQAVARAHRDQRVGRQPADGVVHRRAAEAGQLLQVLHRQQPAGLELAVDQHRLDALIGELEEVQPVAPRRRVQRILRHQLRLGLPCSHRILPNARFAVDATSGRLFDGLSGDDKHVVIFYKHSYGRRRARPI